MGNLLNDQSLSLSDDNKASLTSILSFLTNMEPSLSNIVSLASGRKKRETSSDCSWMNTAYQEMSDVIEIIDNAISLIESVSQTGISSVDNYLTSLKTFLANKTKMETYRVSLSASISMYCTSTSTVINSISTASLATSTSTATATETSTGATSTAAQSTSTATATETTTGTTSTAAPSTSTATATETSTVASTTSSSISTTVDASLVAIQSEVGEMQSEVTDQASTLTNLLSNSSLTDSMSNEAVGTLNSVLEFLNSLGPTLGNIASLASGRFKRDSDNDCSLMSQTNTKMSAAIQIVDSIVSLIDDLGSTGNTQVDNFLTLLKTEKAAVKGKLQGLVNANSQNIGSFCTTLQSTASSSTSSNQGTVAAAATSSSSLTTAASSLELIKESASTVKTETDAKIAQLNTILANSNLSPSVKEALESLLAMLTTLSGDFGTIATVGETTTASITTTNQSTITTAEAIQGAGRFKREDLTCAEMAKIVSDYNGALAKVDAILEKLAEIWSLGTPPSEVAEFCSSATADFAALKNDDKTGRASRISC